MMKTKRLRGLFFKAVFVLTLISLVPVGLIGFHVLRVNSRLLQREIVQRQQNVARRLSSVAESYLTHLSQFFIVFTDLHTDFGGHNFLDLEDLDYLRQREPVITFLTALDLKGKPVVSSGKQEAKALQESELSVILQTCVREQHPYIGPVFRQPDGKAGMLLAFPIRHQVNSTQILGVLLAEIALTDLDHMLAQAYPLEMEALLVDASGKIISYNGSPEGSLGEISAELTKQLQYIRQQLNGKNWGKVIIPQEQNLLVASANLLLTDWTVYVFQPANIATQLFKESTFQSGWDVLLMVGCVILFLIGVSYIVIIPITRPIERLRTAALKLRETEDYVIKQEEVETPNNEIGDLSKTIVEMSQALHARREALASANQDLEKRVEERTRELKETTNELVRVERLASIGQMASIISHEIRNPLAVISNSTRLIKLLIPAQEPKLTKQINIIEAEIKQANSIISEVLGYARTRELMLSTIDLNSYLHDLVTVYSFPANIQLVEELEAESVRIKVDAEEIKQALRNVISNAVDAMQPQGGTLRIGTKIGRRLVCIYIADTGPGISPEVRKKMFAPFFTTKARGTGLGLAVVGKAVSRHKGKLFIFSEPGKGSCFQIYLKIYKKTGDTNYGEAS